MAAAAVVAREGIHDCWIHLVLTISGASVKHYDPAETTTYKDQHRRSDLNNPSRSQSSLLLFTTTITRFLGIKIQPERLGVRQVCCVDNPTSLGSTKRLRPCYIFVLQEGKWGRSGGEGSCDGGDVCDCDQSTWRCFCFYLFSLEYQKGKRSKKLSITLIPYSCVPAQQQCIFQTVWFQNLQKKLYLMSACEIINVFINRRMQTLVW